VRARRRIGERAGALGLVVALLGVLSVTVPLAASAFNYVTTNNGEQWGVQDEAAPDVDTGSIRETTSNALQGYGGIRVKVSTLTDPAWANGALMRGFHLQYDPPNHYVPNSTPGPVPEPPAPIAPTTGPATTPPATTASTTTPVTPPPHNLLVLPSLAKEKVNGKGQLIVPLTCTSPGDATCSVTLLLKSGTTILASKTFNLPSGKKTGLVFPLNKAGRKLLASKKHGKHSVTLVASFGDAYGLHAVKSTFKLTRAGK
jgi:hypothetical protein